MPTLPTPPICTHRAANPAPSRLPRRLLRTVLLTAALASAAGPWPAVRAEAPSTGVAGSDTPTSDARDRSATPWPEGWPRQAVEPPPSRRPGPRQQQFANPPPPLWGVPAVSAPQADHCRGPLRSSETPGDAALQPTATRRSDSAGAHDERRALTDRAETAMAAEAAGAPEGAAAEPSALARSPSERGKALASPALRAPAPPQAFMPRRDRDRDTQTASGPVTAGVVDDNADFGAYLSYRDRSAGLDVRSRDVSERYRVDVRGADGLPVPDAELALTWPGAARAVVWARTDAGGSAWLHPRALLAPRTLDELAQVQVLVRAPRAWGSSVGTATLQRGQKAVVSLRVAGHAPAQRPRLDLAFLIDATGSMGDEIAKLKASVRDIADQIGSLPGQPDICLGLVAYRDQADAFLLRTQDFTDALPAFQRGLASLSANGGGDEPEALNAALDEAVNRLSWRADATRLVVLIADAPPQPQPVDPAPPHDSAAAAALARGIKLHAVGTSGLSPAGESVFRQLAQTTGGRFVFLTYRDAADPGSGPGSETVHDVSGYSVQTLDRLIVRLVREELARRRG